MFELINQALIAQTVLIIMASTMAYVEYSVRAHGLRHSTFFITYLFHLALQALVTFAALGVATYFQASWLFGLNTTFPWIFGTAGVAVVTFFISHKFWSANYEAA